MDTDSATAHDPRKDFHMARQEIEAAMAKHGLTVEAVFIPWSQSRHKDEKDDRGNPRHSLNWRVTLRHAAPDAGSRDIGARDILTTDYSAGAGRCPAYNSKPPHQWDREAKDWQQLACAWECEKGRKATYWGHAFSSAASSKPLMPDACDVLHSLVSDSDVLDYATYEEWASDLGFDPDSRKGEAMYRACLEIALKLRNALGEAVIAELREAGEDY